jgi:hypothetical protein
VAGGAPQHRSGRRAAGRARAPYERDVASASRASRGRSWKSRSTISAARGSRFAAPSLPARACR